MLIVYICQIPPNIPHLLQLPLKKILNQSFKYWISFIICACVYTCVSKIQVWRESENRSVKCTCGGQKTVLYSRFSPPLHEFWDLHSDGQADFKSNVWTSWAIFPAQFWIFYLCQQKSVKPSLSIHSITYLISPDVKSLILSGCISRSKLLL